MSRDEEIYPQIPLCIEESIQEGSNILRVYQDVQKACTNRGNWELTPFGFMVKMALAKMKKKQVDLAKSIGVSKQYLYLVLHGRRPGTKYIDRIVVYCNLSPEAAEKAIAERRKQKTRRQK